MNRNKTGLNILILCLFLLTNLTVAAAVYASPIAPVKNLSKIKPNKTLTQIQKSKAGKPKKVGNKTYIQSETIVGRAYFPSTIKMGQIGEHATHRRMTGMGYRKISSKYDTNRGIDGIYEDPKTGKLIITETKVNGAKLSTKTQQMSDKWLKTTANKLIKSDDADSVKTGQKILGALKNNPSVIEKQLWQHDLKSGATKVYKLDEKANIVQKSNPVYSWNDRMLKNILETQCQSGKIICPTSQPK